MKNIVFGIFLLIISVGTASAQETFSADEFHKKLGKTGTLCDTIYSLHIVNDTLTLLNMGAVYPNQKYTIAVKGNKINLDWTKLKGKPLCVTGVFILYKEKPEIEVTEPEKINVKQP